MCLYVVWLTLAFKQLRRTGWLNSHVDLVLANQHLPIQLNGKIERRKGVIEKDADEAAESLIHAQCLRSVLNCDHLKRVNSSKALGAVGAQKLGIYK